MFGDHKKALTMSIKKSLCVACATLIAAAPLLTRAAPQTQAAALPVAIGDYHMHLQGPEIAAAMADLRARNPALLSDYPEDAFNATGFAEALAALDEAGIREGTLLSVAYMVSSPMLGIAPGDIDRVTRKENQLTVDAALASPGLWLSMPIVLHSRSSKAHGAVEERIIFDQVSLSMPRERATSISICPAWS